MGNCGQRGLRETDDHKDVCNSVDTHLPKEVPHKETRNEDEVEEGEIAQILTKEVDEGKHQTGPSAEGSEEYENYHHVEDGLENYSEWDIVQFDCITPLIEDNMTEVIGIDSVNSLAHTHSEDNIVPVMEPSLQMELATTAYSTLPRRSRRSSSKGRFSESEGGHLYTLHENKESSDNNVNYLDRISPTLKDGKDTMSLQSYMSNVSTVSMITNYDPVLAYRLASAQIQVHLNYDPKAWLLRVGVKQIECSLDPTFENLQVYWQVHMALLPFKRQRLKTKYKGSSNAIFNQAFDVKLVDKSVLKQIAVRYRLYGRFGRAGRKRLAGEMTVEVASLSKKPNKVLEWRELITTIPGTRRKSYDSV